MSEKEQDNDSLVKKKWVEWRKFNIEWPDRSYDDFARWLEYKDKIGPELMDIANKWKIFYRPNEESIAFTPEFQSYWRREMKYLFEVNSKILEENIVPNGEVSPFIEYGFVQIISYYIGLNQKQFNNLPRDDPDKLNTIFELSRMVFGLLDNEFSGGEWDKVREHQEEMLKEREEFKNKIDKK